MRRRSRAPLLALLHQLKHRGERDRVERQRVAQLARVVMLERRTREELRYGREDRRVVAAIENAALADASFSFSLSGDRYFAASESSSCHFGGSSHTGNGCVSFASFPAADFRACHCFHRSRCSFLERR